MSASTDPLSPPEDPLSVLRDPSLASHREQLVEYVFLSELLQDAWLRRKERLDILRADVDGAGYDLVVECEGVQRHIQMKSSVVGGAARSQKVHSALATQRSGCVVWVVLEAGATQRLKMSFLVLGGGPDESLPELDAHPVARHTKGNAEGFKSLRAAIREVPRSAFEPLPDMTALSDWLFGPPR